MGQHSRFTRLTMARSRAPTSDVINFCEELQAPRWIFEQVGPLGQCWKFKSESWNDGCGGVDVREDVRRIEGMRTIEVR